MFAVINSVGLLGLNAFAVKVEIEASKGLPSFDIVGLADASVKESRERVRSALRSSEITLPLRKIIINLAPADVRKTGSVYDLAVAVALLRMADLVDDSMLSTSAFIGELSLSGEVRPVQGVLPMTIMAQKMGLSEIYVPTDNVREASVVEGIKAYGVRSLRELVFHFEKKAAIVPAAHYKPTAESYFGSLDFADVKGQENVKRALEVAAAGGHNLIMIGAPGSGKSMMAKCLPSILPPLTLAESLETTKIHSVAGKLGKDSSLIAVRPFRSPHHTISQVAMVGGGSSPQPGEISLAHNGVLFLDELPEFNRSVLEVLRQPLEDRRITISRSKYTLEYPASFTLIASMNPCPCGYYNHPTRHCVCSPGQVQRYLNKISGPLLDRIDIQIEIVPVPFEKLSEQTKGESSAAIRERVIRARQIQASRFAHDAGVHCNAQMSSRLLHQYALPDEKGLSLLRNAMERFHLSARAYDRILKVSRTIADLENAEHIQPHHLAEAISYRNLDRENWAG